MEPSPEMMALQGGPVEYVTSRIERGPGNKLVKTTRIITTYVTDEANDSYDAITPPNLATEGGNDKVLSWLLQNNTIDDSGNSSLHEQSSNGDPQNELLAPPGFGAHGGCDQGSFSTANDDTTLDGSEPIQTETLYHQRFQSAPHQSTVMGLANSKHKGFGSAYHEGVHYPGSEIKTPLPDYDDEPALQNAVVSQIAPPTEFMDIPPPPNYPAPSPPKLSNRSYLPERSASMPSIYSAFPHQQYYYDPEIAHRMSLHVIHENALPMQYNPYAVAPAVTSQGYIYPPQGYTYGLQPGMCPPQYPYFPPVIPPPPSFQPPSPPVQRAHQASTVHPTATSAAPVKKITPPPPSFTPPPPPSCTQSSNSLYQNSGALIRDHQVGARMSSSESYEALLKKYSTDAHEFPPPPPAEHQTTQREKQETQQHECKFSHSENLKPSEATPTTMTTEPLIAEPQTHFDAPDDPIYSTIQNVDGKPQTECVAIEKKQKNKKDNKKKEKTEKGTLSKFFGKRSKSTSKIPEVFSEAPPPPPPPPAVAVPPPPPPPVLEPTAKSSSHRRKSDANSNTQSSRGDLLAELRAANGVTSLKKFSPNADEIHRQSALPSSADARSSLLAEIKAANGMKSLRKRPERNSNRDLDLGDTTNTTSPKPVDLLSELKASNGKMSLRRTKKPAKWGAELGLSEINENPGQADDGKSEEDPEPIYHVPLKKSQHNQSSEESKTEVPTWKKQLLAKQAAEKLKKETESQEKAKEQAQIPVWKRALLEKKAVEESKHGSQEGSTDNSADKKSLGDEEERNNSGEKLAPWQLELRKKKDTD